LFLRAVGFPEDFLSRGFPGRFRACSLRPATLVFDGARLPGRLREAEQTKRFNVDAMIEAVWLAGLAQR
jgi:hypothetical protein